MAERVESPPPGSAVTLSSLGPLMRGGERNLLTDFPQIPSRPIRSKLFLSGVNDRLCLSHSRAVASAAIWITKRLKMKASLSSKKKKKKSFLNPILHILSSEGKPASQSYLAKCAFPRSVRHTGRAWEARYTAAAAAETENTAQVGEARTRGCRVPGRTGPSLSHARREAHAAALPVYP